MTKIKIGIIGVGNCASSLVQGIHYYRDKRSDEAIGLMHWDVGGYKPFNVEVVAAFDIDARKVNKDVTTAIFSPPNCTTVFCSVIPETNTRVQMGPVLDGYSDHMSNYADPETFVLSDEPPLTKNQFNSTGENFDEERSN
jgi:myo-inositol-1-phosphate synthase